MAAAVVAICSVWVALSQVRILPLKEANIFLGLDGWVGFLEEPTINARMTFRGVIPSPVRVCYVDVDTDSIQALGNFPWNRAVFAEALNDLFELGKVRAVGLDFVFSSNGIPQLGREEAEAGSLQLGRSVKKNANVVLAATYGAETGILGKQRSFPFVFRREFSPERSDLPELPDYPVTGPVWGHVGLIDTMQDDVRCIPFFAQTEHKTYLQMSLQLALLHWGLSEANVSIENDALVVRKEDGSIERKVPLILGQLVEPNWFSPWLSAENPRAGIASVLSYARLFREGSDEEKADAGRFFEAFRDAVVLIGPTDPLLKDVSPAPMSGARPVPRVSLHGNMLKTLVSGELIQRPPTWLNALIILVMGSATAFLSVLPAGRWPWPRILASAVVLFYVAGCFIAFSTMHLVLPLVAPVGAAVSCSFAAALLQLGVEQQQRRRIKELFGSYVSRAVVEEMVERNIPPQTGGVEVEITAFFSDIVSFSPLAEKLAPKELVELMSDYLGEGTASVMEAGGTLDKYVGDAIVAIFGAPLPCDDHAAAASRAALALQLAQSRLQKKWAAESGRWPVETHRMRTRIGLHTGPAIVGNIGSRLRFNYTMMGATVNLTQRLEAAVGHYGTSILASSETCLAATAHDRSLAFRFLDRVYLAGSTKPMDLHELLGVGEGFEARIVTFASARKLYDQHLWTEARQGFLEAAELESNPLKNPPLVLARRCEDILEGRWEYSEIFSLTKAG